MLGCNAMGCDILEQFFAKERDRKLTAREIDRHLDSMGSKPLAIMKRRMPNLFAKLADQPQVFGHRDKGSGRDPAEVRLKPARQGLDIVDTMGVGIDQGLIVIEYPPGADCRDQPLLDIDLLLARSLRWKGREKLNGIASLRLGIKHRPIGMGQQDLSRFGVIWIKRKTALKVT